ncbi:MAG: hypothetical protein EU548_00110 [Promethearchaeota archaeon]|nr:MAG: hypothetical protein EU548_00110 [Candidatus Lokiarchaeota archaeon]
MKEVRILSLDNRGRIVIPHTVRKTLGIQASSQIMLIADSETKEVKIKPIGMVTDSPIKFRITMEDSPGSLGKIATTFGKYGISLVYGEALTVEKDKVAVWTVIGPSPDKIGLEKFKEILLTEGDALDVEIIPLLEEDE